MMCLRTWKKTFVRILIQRLRLFKALKTQNYSTRIGLIKKNSFDWIKRSFKLNLSAFTTVNKADLLFSSERVKL